MLETIPAALAWLVLRPPRLLRRRLVPREAERLLGGENQVDAYAEKLGSLDRRSRPSHDPRVSEVITGRAGCYSSGTPGRAIVQVRSNHLVTDDPATPLYGGPGEAPSSLELFLSGIVSCAVLMLERIAHAEGLTLGPLRAEMEATRDPESPGLPPVLDSARLTFVFTGMSREEAGQLVQTFKGR